MGRKKNITIIEKYTINSFSEAPILDKQFSKLSHYLNIMALTFFTFYYIGALNMMDKLFTFIISGKLIGTDYVLKFSDVCWISATLVAAILAKSIYNYLKVAKNRNKIRLQIREASPLSLTVRITA
jgi:hypothetical protein